MSATDPSTRYQSPLAGRYASSAMQAIWSDQRKFTTWRRLWLALAEAEHALGLPITPEQLDQLRAHLDDIDYDKAADYERRFRHDVMAHVHAFGDAAPLARPIIHLGATSQFVGCNTELLQIRDALRLIADKLAALIDRLAAFAAEHRALPTLGFTHLQAAQPTTVGKRAAGWAYDMVLALEDLEHRLNTLRFRGAKGATGTQASFLALFADHDDPHGQVEKLDLMVTQKMGFEPGQRFALTGQTYPRIVDAQLLGSLAATAAGLAKFATDVRLLVHRKELDEPFEAEQIGSSAMPYKRNPMRCERICALTRFVMSLADNATMTAATQWMERTLDDSANRRLSLPESFLALDGSLDLAINVASGLVVYPAVIRANLMAELPFMASEDLLMAAVKAGGDRQQLHERIRQHSLAAAQRIKGEGAANDLIDRLRHDPAFARVDFSEVMDPARHVGRAPELVDAFIDQVVAPLRARYALAIRSERPTLSV